MTTNDLTAPLGQNKRKKRLTLPITAPQAVAGALGVVTLVVTLWALLVDDPLGGEPMVVVATNLSSAKAAPREAGAPPAPAGTENIVRNDGAVPPTAQAVAKALPPGSKVITLIDGSSGKREDVVIPAPANGKQAIGIDQRLLETTRHGAIPRIAADGARPSSVYARPLKLAAGKADAPRIALIISGLGISAAATADAIGKLPGAVTLAVAPYSGDIENLAAQARAAEHEVLLQTPMEPFDYPGNDPGPQTLLTSLTAEQNIDRLQWLMSRFQGYVGIANYMGARFTASEQALAPVLREIAKRGLIFVDDGSSPRSLVGHIAGGSNIPFAKADMMLDATPTAVEIDRALSRLEMQARDRGTAVAFANATPAVVARIVEWAKKVEARGFVLVPITAVAIKAKSS